MKTATNKVKRVGQCGKFDHLTQVDLAEAIGKSRPTINAWRREGMPRNADGSYCLPRVVAWAISKGRAK